MSPDKVSCKTWQSPEQQTTSFAAGKKRSIESEELLVNKRCKSSSSPTTNEWSLDSDEFPISLSPNESGPLGLRLNKSPSLLELIQKRLLHECKKNDALPHENLQAGSKKHVKEQVQASSTLDKLKASNFQGLLLRIGKWEYKSKHEGDLVAKCYFAKHRIVWEVLDGGLKNKIEMQWSDIVGLKANCPDNGPGTLTILLGKQPLFFRETDPQPRKHTIWQATSDFTNGEASTYRQHYLECPQGVLNKHYEKLIQCDTRLNFLSQQSRAHLDLPFVANDPNVLNNAKNGCSQPEVSKGFSISHINKTSTLDLVCGDFVKEYGYGKIPGLEGSETIGGQINTPRLQQSTSNSDLGNPIRQHCIAEKKPDLVSENMTMLDRISQILQNDTQLITAASDEKSLVSRFDWICSLLEDGNDYPNPDYPIPENGDQDVELITAASYEKSLVSRFDSICGLLEDGNDYPNLDYPIPENGDQDVGMSRKDSFSDLVDQLPGITSLPTLAPSFGGKILNP